MTGPITVRDARPRADAGACAAIYAPFVSGTAVSFEQDPPDADAFAARIERLSARYPYLIAETTDGATATGPGAVIGFAYAAPHRERAAYRWAVETSVYVDPGAHRRGVGRALYGALLPLLAQQGLTLALAGITLPNDASVALHESLGFEPIGVYRAVGFKAGAWRDVGWWQRSLQAAGSAPPAEPGPPPRLAG